MIEIQIAGPFTTIQDRGRQGYQHIGVPTSGALDDDALLLGNALIGNHESCAAIEICFGGFQASVDRPTALCLTGSIKAQMIIHKPTGKRLEIACAVPVVAEDGDRIEIPPFGDTLSAVLAIGGGIDVALIYGSRSTTVNAMLGGLEGRCLQDGDKLDCGNSDTQNAQASACDKDLYEAHFAPQTTLRIIAGPQDFWFTPEALATLTTTPFLVSPQTSRMGMRLSGESLAHKGPADIISDGMVRGAIQVPADGQPIIAMADHGTMGGYTKIACVISADLGALGRLRPNLKITFEMVTEKEAKQALEAKSARLRALMP